MDRVGICLSKGDARDSCWAAHLPSREALGEGTERGGVWQQLGDLESQDVDHETQQRALDIVQAGTSDEEIELVKLIESLSNRIQVRDHPQSPRRRQGSRPPCVLCRALASVLELRYLPGMRKKRHLPGRKHHLPGRGRKGKDRTSLPSQSRVGWAILAELEVENFSLRSNNTAQTGLNLDQISLMDSSADKLLVPGQSRSHVAKKMKMKKPAGQGRKSVTADARLRTNSQGMMMMGQHKERSLTEWTSMEAGIGGALPPVDEETMDMIISKKDSPEGRDLDTRPRDSGTPQLDSGQTLSELAAAVAGIGDWGSVQEDGKLSAFPELEASGSEYTKPPFVPVSTTDPGARALTVAGAKFRVELLCPDGSTLLCNHGVQYLGRGMGGITLKKVSREHIALDADIYTGAVVLKVLGKNAIGVRESGQGRWRAVYKNDNCPLPSGSEFAMLMPDENDTGENIAFMLLVESLTNE
ncbi:hypothetical protein CYMTET_46087 [Cymbomonas tetramitiformis]|uniref:Uncharacterized protein n=1 Tax=Cymbomonas tetramitiformis TaxID=36881 RepID=A0AAE0BYD3_9CHLO|nr:hypothetical protein CYMTET_46087 [Cymbomonas tetramitiformis]